MESLWANPDQAGYLFKRSDDDKPYRKRFFILKGSNLFYFKDRTSSRQLAGVIPIEMAKIESEAPPSPQSSSSPNNPRTNNNNSNGGPLKKKSPDDGLLTITITLNAAHATTSRHPYYTLATDKREVHAAWAARLWQAAIPRSDLENKLTEQEYNEVLRVFAERVMAAFPTADASVLSSGKMKRWAVGNLTTLPAMMRRASIQNAMAPPTITGPHTLPAIQQATYATTTQPPSSVSVTPMQSSPSSMNITEPKMSGNGGGGGNNISITASSVQVH